MYRGTHSLGHVVTKSTGIPSDWKDKRLESQWCSEPVCIARKQMVTKAKKSRIIGFKHNARLQADFVFINANEIHVSSQLRSSS